MQDPIPPSGLDVLAPADWPPLAEACEFVAVSLAVLAVDGGV
jgi:hypothetical protein